MTLNTTDSKVAYAGDGSTTVFAIPFKFLADGDIEALLRDDATGEESGWAQNTQYALAGAGNESGGTLTVATSPTDWTPQAGQTLVIRRNAAEVQGAAFPAGGAFPSSTVETGLDRLTMLVQQHSESIGRALSVPATDPDDAIGPLPSSVSRASQFLAFDASGKPVAAAPPEGGNIVSAFMATMLDDATAAAAQATLGLAVGTNVQAYSALLAAIAGVSAAANKLPYFTGASAAGLLDFKDEDDMASDSATAVPSQQSVKAYVATAGSWTPTLTFATPGDLSVAYSTQVGAYLKIGRLVIAWFSVVTSTFTHTSSSGSLRISGLPCTVEQVSSLPQIGAGTMFQGVTKTSYTQFAPYAVGNQTYGEFAASGSGQSVSTVSASDMPSGGTVQLTGTLIFHTVS